MILHRLDPRSFDMRASTLWAWLPLKRRRRRTWVTQRIQVVGDPGGDDDSTKWPILGLGHYQNGTGWGLRESRVTARGMSLRGTSHRGDGTLDLYIYHAGGRMKVRTGIPLQAGEDHRLTYLLDAGRFPTRKGRIAVWVDGVKVEDVGVWFHVRPSVFGHNRWSPSETVRPGCTLFVSEQVIATRKKDVL